MTTTPRPSGQFRMDGEWGTSRSVSILVHERASWSRCLWLSSHPDVDRSLSGLPGLVRYERLTARARHHHWQLGHACLGPLGAEECVDPVAQGDERPTDQHAEDVLDPATRGSVEPCYARGRRRCCHCDCCRCRSRSCSSSSNRCNNRKTCVEVNDCSSSRCNWLGRSDREDAVLPQAESHELTSMMTGSRSNTQMPNHRQYRPDRTAAMSPNVSTRILHHERVDRTTSRRSTTMIWTSFFSSLPCVVCW